MTKKTAAGAVLPPGTIKAEGAIAPGTYEILIESVEPVGSDPADGVYATCVYPDGRAKDHQVMPADVAGLFDKVVGRLRGRYGAGEVKLVHASAAVAAGAALTVEV